MRVVDGVDLQAFDEPVLEIVREVETLGAAIEPSVSVSVAWPSAKTRDVLRS